MDLRVKGATLDPAEVTRLLGCKPTSAQVKGAQVQWHSSLAPYLAETGNWHLKAQDRVPADLDAQVAEVLAPLSHDLNVWRELTAKLSVRLFCVLFGSDIEAAKRLSSESLAALGERGIVVDFSFHGPRNRESRSLSSIWAGE
jgi:hypothetical protein